MAGEAFAVLAVAVACGVWALAQRFVAARDPDQPGVERSRCGSCRGGCEDRCHERA